MATQFFAHLGLALAARGHSVKRINFNAGDRLFWRLPGSVAYRGALDAWPAFFEQCLNDWRITDLVLFGDCRPLHIAAIRIATLRGLPVHVFEEGYLRPNWVTLEAGGVNANSALPRDPAWFLQQAAALPPWSEPMPVGDSFRRRSVMDVGYYTCGWLFGWRYPGYRSHLAWHPFLEYAGWIGRFFRTPLRRRRTDQALRKLAGIGAPYYLVALQLDSDSQIRFHSPFGRLGPAIETIVRSFAHHAPSNAVLVLKEHPLDPQLTDWHRLALATARSLGIAERIVYLAGGPLDSLLRGSRGVVTVNSTAGITGLSLGVPVVTLARPIYDVPGLTFQDGLDRFWREGVPPDAALFDAFRRVVASQTQLNGGFFTARGLQMAVAASILRLEQADFQALAARPAAAAGSPMSPEGFAAPAQAD